MSTVKKHYVNNQQFLQALIEHRAAIKTAKKAGKPKPVLPDFIGECFLKIAEHLSYKPNFLNYTFREDMVGDGVENCLIYVDNFDPDKSKNPFAYFTQIMYYAFIRRIQKENKQLYIKYKAIQHSDAFDTSVNQGHDDTAYDNTYVKFLQKNMGDIISTFEERKKGKRRKTKPHGIELFFTDECSNAEGEDPAVSSTLGEISGRKKARG